MQDIDRETHKKFMEVSNFQIIKISTEKFITFLLLIYMKKDYLKFEINC